MKQTAILAALGGVAAFAIFAASDPLVKFALILVAIGGVAVFGNRK